MTLPKIKRVPFDLELARKITNKETKGRIVTRDGRQARVICFDRKEIDDIFDPPKNIVALVTNKDGGEGVFAVRNDGMILLNEETYYDLLIEVPICRDYSNFVPQKWQPCLVRDGEEDEWKIQVCAKKDKCGRIVFYNEGGFKCTWMRCLPLTNVTARLIGKTKSYEQLIKELDENEQD